MPAAKPLTCPSSKPAGSAVHAFRGLRAAMPISTITLGSEAAYGGNGVGSTADPVTGKFALIAASLEIDAVADRVPAEVGSKVIVSLHDWPGATGAAQVSDSANIAAFWPENDKLVISSGAVPVFEIVTTCGAEAVPTVWTPNATAAEPTEISGAMPLPDNDTEGFDSAFVSIRRFAPFAPGVDGENVTATRHESPAPSVAPQAFDKPKDVLSALEIEICEIDRIVVPGFEILTDSGALLPPTNSFPNCRLALDT